MRRLTATLVATVAVLGLAAVPASAKPKGWGHKPAGSIVDVAVKASSANGPDANPYDYDLLIAAVTATGLAPVLDDESQRFTVFAPNDRAFARLVADLSGTYPASEQATLDAVLATLTVDQIKNVLLYHVVPGKRLGPLQVLFARSLTMANGGTVKPRGLSLQGRDAGAARSAARALGAEHPGHERRDPHDRPRAGARDALGPESVTG